MAVALGCSASQAGDTLPSFNDLTSASPAIRGAARGVVRVTTANGIATGSFVSASGLLLTNNHVLGDTVCPVEGCYLQLTEMHQRGEPIQQAQVVFGVPVTVDVGLDVALVQLYSFSGGPELSTPDYLTLRPIGLDAMLGQHVTVVGHPEGYLKKWTDGVVVDLLGSWFLSTAFILPGDSGSPALDDDGNLIGLVHRAPTGEDLITSDGVQVYSLGTAYASVAAVEGAPLPPEMISIAAATTQTVAVSDNLVYLNAHVSTVTVETGSATLLSLLASACDAGLAEEYESPEDLDAKLAPCYEVQESWIECRMDATPVPQGVLCPSQVDATAWANRYQSVNQRWIEMNGRLYLDGLSFGVAQLSDSVVDGFAAGAESLQQALSASQPLLDFDLAYYLAAFGIASYGGNDIGAYVKGYAATPGYELQAANIAGAAMWLYSHDLVDRTSALSVLSQLHDDPNVSVGAKLYIEDMEYYEGAL
jgi:hypothetical protein